MRVIIAANKGDPDALIGALMVRVKGYWPEADVVPAIKAWSDLFTGDWDGYAREVGRGFDVAGAALFDVIVVPNLVIGRVTGSIVEHALSVAKPVLYIPYDPAVTPAVVSGVGPRDTWHRNLLVQP